MSLESESIINQERIEAGEDAIKTLIGLPNRCFAGRAGLLGDVVTCLPLVHVLKKMYGNNIELTWPLSNKCKQMAPLMISQPGIKSIYITQDEEFLNDKEKEWISKEFDVIVNCTPNHPRQSDWYNYRNMIDETILQAGELYYEVFQTLPEKLKKPRLFSWWDNGQTKIQPKTIAIHTTAGYSKDSHRSPSEQWWLSLLDKLFDFYGRGNGLEVIRFGHPDEKSWHLYGAWNYPKDMRYLSLFEQVQLASKCEYYIGTDSGFSIIMAALGKQKRAISLITDWLPQHHSNPYSLAPVGWNDNITTLFAPGGCDNISIKNVLEVIENSN